MQYISSLNSIDTCNKCHKLSLKAKQGLVVSVMSNNVSTFALSHRPLTLGSFWPKIPGHMPNAGKKTTHTHSAMTLNAPRFTAIKNNETILLRFEHNKEFLRAFKYLKTGSTAYTNSMELGGSVRFSSFYEVTYLVRVNI